MDFQKIEMRSFDIGMGENRYSMHEIALAPVHASAAPASQQTLLALQLAGPDACIVRFMAGQAEVHSTKESSCSSIKMIPR
jgi:hypothetical protein